MSLRALKQPFQATFQPLPSTPTQSSAKSSQGRSSKGRGPKERSLKSSLFSKSTKSQESGVITPLPLLSTPLLKRDETLDTPKDDGATFRIESSGKNLYSPPTPSLPVGIAVLNSQPAQSRAKTPGNPRRLLKRPPAAQPAPKSPPAPPRFAYTSNAGGIAIGSVGRKFDTWTSATSGSRIRRANKAALALRHVLLDINFEGDAGDVGEGALRIVKEDTTDGASKGKDKDVKDGKEGRASSGLRLGQSKKQTMVPRLRLKDVERLQTQLLKPDTAGMVIASARSLSGGPRSQLRLDALGLDLQPSPLPPPSGSDPSTGSEPRWAVCLDVDENTASSLLSAAAKTSRDIQTQSDHLANHPYSTLKHAPPPPARLPIILSLLQAVPKLEMPGEAATSSILPFGLMQPPSAMSLHRPLAGALPTPETLRRGFDALINAESKIYKYQGPSHGGLYPPTDRMSVFTYWWGFELALPPPTLEYLSQAKQISTSLLDLLGIIVYAVPGGTRELAPFVGVLSRFIETEWAVLMAQNKGKGVVCGATWFIPAAIVARPWDFDDAPGSQEVTISSAERGGS